MLWFGAASFAPLEVSLMEQEQPEIGLFFIVFDCSVNMIYPQSVFSFIYSFVHQLFH